MRRQSSFSARFIGGDPELPKQYVNKKNEPKEKRPGFLKEYIMDYTSNTNLHGLKYIGENERTVFEKVFWSLMFICCVILCANLIKEVWIKSKESPVIVNFEETTSPVWQIPYPAITVCFQTKIMSTKYNFTNYYHLYEDINNMTEEEKYLFQDISLICDSHLSPSDGRLTSDPAETVQNIISMAPKIDYYFLYCNWKNKDHKCEELFRPILTEEGQCFTFNMLSAEEVFRTENLHEDYQYLETRNFTANWSLESGYDKNSPIETYPRRGTGYGAKAGMRFALQAYETDLDYLCKGPVQGFKILLHNPAELPWLSQQYFNLPFSQEVMIAVKPQKFTTSERLRSYKPTSRECFFMEERYLRYFKVYTQSNCEMECLSNFTYVRCGCVQFGMPRGPDVPVSNAGNVICMEDAKMELVTVEVLHGINESNEDLGDDQIVAESCQCLPSCTSLEYEAETSQAYFDWRAMLKALKSNIIEEYEDLLFSRVNIFFKHAQYVTTRQAKLYSKTDILANCGGLLGLFMGFSILSVVEFLYFFTLRIFCLLWKRHQARKATTRKKQVDPIGENDKRSYTD